jgi:hypothetical protein
MPLVYMTLVVAVPLTLFMFNNWLHLQSGWLPGRPPMGVRDERQLLTVGFISSGTTNTQRGLAGLGRNRGGGGGLEVCHEDGE